MRENVTLHPETVQKAAELASEQATKRRRKKAGGREPSRNSQVERKRVHPQVLEKALALAGGNRKRLVIESEKSVLVKNHE